MTPAAARNSRTGIEIMTAWASDPDGLDGFVFQRMRALAADRPDGNEMAAALEMVLGLVNVAGGLLIRREKEVGVRDVETLREMALEIERDAPQ